MVPGLGSFVAWPLMGNLSVCRTVKGWRACRARVTLAGRLPIRTSIHDTPRLRQERDSFGRQPRSRYSAGDSMKPIRKAIFPVAGLGTRFLPATKAMPKEMLPVVDRPLIQHVVDEAREAGIEHFIFVTGRNKARDRGPLRPPVRARAHAHRSAQRRADLEALARDLPGPGTASFTRQQSPLGLGHAVWCARELVGQRAVRAAAARRAGAERARLPRADDRCLRASCAKARTSSRSRRCRTSACTCTAWSASASARASCSGSRRWWRSRSARRRRRTSSSPAATSCSRRFSTCSRPSSRGAGGEIQLTDAMIELAKTQPFYGLEVRRPQLRLRLEDRLPQRQYRLCARAPRHRPGDAGRAQAPARRRLASR